MRKEDGTEVVPVASKGYKGKKKYSRKKKNTKANNELKLSIGKKNYNPEKL
jgi:hypothetical protein